jgi:membrane protein YdbS with pleckstrin-like domain
VIRAAVTDITMRPEAIAISLALVKVTAIVVVGLAFVLLLLFLAIQLVRHPRWGVNVLNTSLDIVTGA